MQLGILSTRGNLTEAVTLDSGQVSALRGALAEAQGAASRDLMAALQHKEREAAESYRDALARNPWLAGKGHPNERYIRRPR